MLGRTTISDEELRAAAREVLQYELAKFDALADRPDHPFRHEVETKMNNLRHDVNRGAVKAADYHMGWQYYTKNGIAAVLICFLLACATMPEVVLAGYQKLIEVVETIFDEYTEYRYRYDNPAVETIEKISLEYLPSNMYEVSREETMNSIDLVYENNKGQYFVIRQKMILENNKILYKIDTEETIMEKILINNEEVTLFVKEKEIYFMWIREDYRITGQSNLPKIILIDILKNLKL